MLTRLNIQNVALIQEAEINFCAGLNVLSGETGAGKSVILDSVNFVLGAKADKSMIRYGQTKCAVCAEFDISKHPSIQQELVAMELGEDDCKEIIISRSFTIEGRSAIRINGMPANVSMLRRLTAQLVDVHGQSEHFFLLKESNQLRVLDSVADTEALLPLKSALSAELKAVKAHRERLNALGSDESSRRRRMDVLSFQIDEIKNAELEEGEEEELLLKRNKMNSVEKILSSLKEADDALSQDGMGIDGIRTAQKTLSGIMNLDPAYATIVERLENVQAETEDIAESIRAFGEDISFDENELEQTEKRLNEIKLLMRKYGATIADIFTFLQTAEEEYALLVNGSEEIENLNKKIAASQANIYKICCQITTVRKAAAKDFTSRVVRELKTLNIPSAQFEIDFSSYTEQDADSATAEGLDDVCFMFSANAGEPVKPLSKIISGGEMSRFMLAIKTQLSSVNEISTFIFDEIDAGISGKTAKVVGEKFVKIAQHTQIIAVSHLPQIACMADKQFLIQKKEQDEKTLTNVIELTQEGRIEELTRLLGGDTESVSAKQHAAEMIDTANKYKKILSQNL